MISPKDLSRFYLLQGFRSLIAILVVFALSRAVDLGTHTAILALAALAGTLFAGALLQRRCSFSRAVAPHLALFFLSYLALKLADYAVSGGAQEGSEFFVARFQDHLTLIGSCYFISFIGAWFFWTRAQYVSVEALLFGLVFLWMLSSHRNYHLDAPKEVSALAWDLSVAPQHLLLGMGVLFTVLLSLYLLLSTTRPLFSDNRVVSTSGTRRRVAASVAAILWLLMLAGYAAYVNKQYSSNLSRATEGVGQGGKEGESPLGFHSAIGKTKQPAALVRLEGDYSANPWSPMLYLREGALSQFNGRELVIAPQSFDQDVARTKPGRPFISLENEPGPFRDRLVQSIYLLTTHTAPFAVDFPRSIRLIKNPDPDRFELGYQALSFAPKIKLGDLLEEKVGDSSWDEGRLAHYLRAPGSLSVTAPDEAAVHSTEPLPDERGEDLRYRALSQSLTRNAGSPVAKAMAIVSALSATSIYTRKPGHQVSKDGDPVAPYLFSDDRRGYCVHFAHAAVYLLRLAGIPARIATGYLTDLNYAKDGHILLHLGDRHAWPEIYVAGQGWIVADVTPAQAENEQAIVPDEKLLEELMSKIDPAQEIVAPQDLEDEIPVRQSALDKVLNRRVILGSLALALIFIVLLKAWLLFGYLLPAKPRVRAARAYRACMTRASDFTLLRDFGETHREYCARVENAAGISFEQVCDLFERSRYAGIFTAEGEAAAAGVRSFRSSLRSSTPAWKRLLSGFNPLFLLRLNRW